MQRPGDGLRGTGEGTVGLGAGAAAGSGDAGFEKNLCLDRGTHLSGRRARSGTETPVGHHNASESATVSSTECTH